MVKAKYPHARIWEEAIIDKFLDKYKIAGEFEYDVHLKIRDPPEYSFMSEKERLLWRQNTAKRVDIVIKRRREIYVIEVKDRLRPSAVGQALTYKILYEDQFKPKQQVLPGIVTEFTDPDMEFVLKKLNIKLWLV